MNNRSNPEVVLDFLLVFFINFYQINYSFICKRNIHISWSIFKCVIYLNSVQPKLKDYVNHKHTKLKNK